MELREYFKIIGRHWLVFLLSIIVLTLGTFLYLKMQPKTYLASTTLTVNKASAVKQSQVSYYIYDNYYNVQSSQLFSQIVTSWFSSPSVVSEIYDKAGVVVPDVAQSKLSKTFKALRQEPATINVMLVSANRDDTGKLIDAAATVMQEKTNELARTDKENVYDIVKFNSVVSENITNLKFDLIIAFLASIMFGAVLALGIEYFKKS